MKLIKTDTDFGLQIPPLDTSRVAINTAFNTAVLFEIFNMFVADSPWAIGMMSLMAALILTNQLNQELLKQGRSTVLSPALNRTSKIKGSAFFLSSAGLAFSSIANTVKVGFEDTIPLICFCIANGLMGVSERLAVMPTEAQIAAKELPKQPLSRKISDAIFITAATTGVVMTVPDSPLLIKGVFALAAMRGIANAFGKNPFELEVFENWNKQKRQNIDYWTSSNILYATGALLNALDAVGMFEPEFLRALDESVKAGPALKTDLEHLKPAIANLGFCMAYISLQGIINHGGLKQMIEFWRQKEPIEIDENISDEPPKPPAPGLPS